MKPGPRSRVSAPVPDEARLAELVKEIRDGVADAPVELHRIFYPGACFLIQRRLGPSDVSEHARSVLEVVVRKIREGNSVDGRNLPSLVRKLIVQSFPASPDGSVIKDGADRPAVTAAERILAAMSPVEREALRRCYVLGEQPESFLNSLRLTPDQFRAIRLRARAEFSTRTSRKINVAKQTCFRLLEKTY